jgi:hypothetical protein
MGGLGAGKAAQFFAGSTPSGSGGRSCGLATAQSARVSRQKVPRTDAKICPKTRRPDYTKIYSLDIPDGHIKYDYVAVFSIV